MISNLYLIVYVCVCEILEENILIRMKNIGNSW